MKVVFQVRFHTKFGQDLFVTGGHAVFGMGALSKALPMVYKNLESWEATVDLPDSDATDEDIIYNYVLREPDGSKIVDWGQDRKINFGKFRGQTVTIRDSWNYAGYFQNAFYTEPFQQVLLKRMQAKVEPKPGLGGNGHARRFEFGVKAPLLEKNQTLCLLGSSPELGNWNPANPILLGRNPEELSCRVELSLSTFPCEYKYAVYDFVSGTLLRFEDGKNRVLAAPAPGADRTIVRDGFADLPANTWKGAGLAIPVFSLRTEGGFGTGEFADLKLLVDWCVATGLQLIQILPVNDTTATGTWRDSYPYSAVSAFALHPIYLRLEEVATTAESRAVLEEMEAERNRLNGLPELDYEAVVRAKREFLDRVFASEKDLVLGSDDYKTFFEANRTWLMPYALFCCLRDKWETSDFNRWPKYRRYDPAEAESLGQSAEFRDKMDLVCFIQYHLHKQLQAAASYAHERGIILKGDIPIGVYRYGADAWQASELYHMDMQAGAPPDAFAVKGQNWSFPTYNWPRMQQDGFAWWKQRFSQMSRYFDAFRIDHILGFFRIWSIPLDCVEGILGYFVPALPVRGGEFAARGLQFDRARFVEPYITDAVLAQIFGDDAADAAKRFLDQDRFGRYFLKHGFRTQRQVEAALGGHDPKTARLRKGLFDLISNVILLDLDAEGDQFHFRFAIEETLSFKALPPEARSKLKELYIDYFFRRQDDFWMREALKKLPALKRVTNMLVCGEDLGLVPGCVPQVMRDLGLLSLEIQRMPKDSATEFFRPANAPYLSVVAPSTHDMSTIRGWWEEDRARTQRFYNEELHLSGNAPSACEPAVNEAVVLQHLRSPAMWSIFMLQDLLGSDARLRHPDPGAERINVPAVAEHYWRYRMHLPLERLLSERAFTEGLRAAVMEAGRAPVT